LECWTQVEFSSPQAFGLVLSLPRSPVSQDL
jgi:hypothetical protein